MKRSAKRILTMALIVAMAMALITTGFATGGTGDRITVILDGNALSFPDAAPTIRDGYSYVPFRALLEAMGAEVRYDDETQTVTAEKDGTVLNFVIGQESISVTKDGETETVAADAASYIENQRTMIPVNFVAKAFGFLVGWDETERAVVLIDADKLIDAYAGKFSVMDQYLEYSQGFNEKAYAFTGDFTLDMKVTAPGEPAVPVGISGTIEGLSYQNLMNMNLDMSIDISDYFSDLMSLSPEDGGQETQQILDMLKNVEIDYIINLDEGKVYLRSPIFSMAGIPNVSEDSWLYIDLNKIFSMSGVDLDIEALLKAANQSGFAEYLVNAYGLMGINSAGAFDTLTQTLDQMEDMFGDSAFSKAGDSYVSNYASTENGADMTIRMVLNQKYEKINGYDMTMTINMGEDLGSAKITASQTGYKNADVTMTFTVPNLLDYAIKMNMEFTETDRTPDEAPPAESEIVPLF